jgi:hypothetical protein
MEGEGYDVGVNPTLPVPPPPPPPPAAPPCEGDGEAVESVKRDCVGSVLVEGVTLPLGVPPAASSEGVERLVAKEDREEEGDSLPLPLTNGVEDA